MQIRALEPLLKCFVYRCLQKVFFPPTKISRENADNYEENLRQASAEI